MFYLPWYGSVPVPGSNITHTNCSHGVPWIWKVMGDCVVNDHQIASTYLGLASIVVWMSCGIPQMIKNCRNLNGMVGISFFLMFQWFLGDSTNLTGSILTQQLKVQIYTSVWFVTSDLILLMQYAAYRIKKRRSEKYDNKKLNVQAALCFGGVFLLGGIKSLQQLSPLDDSLTYHHNPAGRNILSVSQVGHMHLFKNNVELSGYIVGVVSALFYVGSRLSQIYTNYVLKSTEGLSVVMFWLAVLGNLLYGLAIIVRNVDTVFLIKHLPWIIGSLGIIFLDVTILLQFYYYRRRSYSRLEQPALLQQEEQHDPTVVQ